MDPKEEEFLKRLRMTFRTEAEEHINSISTGLVELENTAEPDLKHDSSTNALIRRYRAMHAGGGGANAE